MIEGLSTKVLDHLGLVSGMYDELGLVEAIDSLIPQDLDQRDVSVGTICKALTLNGLGFVQRRLYMVSSFFEGKPTGQLLGEGVEPGHLNDTVIGRALDAIHGHGTTALFGALCPLVCERLALKPRYLHMDSTTFHLDGAYNSGQSPQEGVVHLVKGYSRDHRPDLNQLVLNLISENRAGIPLHMQVLHGNADDKTSFRQATETHIEQLQRVSGAHYLVADSAFYTHGNVEKNSARTQWITRVPETLSACKELVTKSLEMRPLAEGYTYAPVCSRYAGVPQRWLVIFSQQAYHREAATLKKSHLKQGKKELTAVRRLEKQHFACREDALGAAGKLEKEMKVLTFEQIMVKEHEYHKGKGRQKKGSVPTKRYTLSICAASSMATFQEKLASKGRFILATNQLNDKELPDAEILSAYKGQAKVERGFRFLKDPQFVASTFFVKKPERVEALAFIMTLCLTVYAAIEYRIRQALGEQEQTLPDQLGKPTQKPTARWVFEFFTGIHVLYGTDQPIILNIKPVHIQVIELLGERYKKYYLLE